MTKIPDTFEKLRPSRIKRELIPFIIISAITISSLSYFLYQDSIGSISYSPEVPTINIKVTGEITNSSQQGFLKITPISSEFAGSPWANRFLPAILRKRNSDGGLSIELFQTENLFQIRDDDDWILLPPGKNLDALRTKMAFDVYNMILDDNSNFRLPYSKLVDVYVNGVYQGLYLLSERIDRKMLNLEQEDIENPEENDLIFKASNWNGDFYTFPNSFNSPWEQLFPNIIDCSNKIKDLIEFIHNASETDFFDEEMGIFAILDKNSLIDNLLFGLLLGHEIIEGSSYYLVLKQESASGFFFLPWNFGQSWGFYKHGRIPTELWLNKNQIDSVVWSKIYYRLLFPEESSKNKEFIKEIVNRWNYLSNSFWNTNKLVSYFNKLYFPIKNSLIHTMNNGALVDSLVETMQNWIITRCNLLDNIIVPQNKIFFDNFKSPYQKDDAIFGFSSPAARRYYHKSSSLFSTQKIHEVSVVIQRDYFYDMINRKYDNSRWTERIFMPSDFLIDNYSMDNTGFRIRANYNRRFPKDSFKLKFSETKLYLGGGLYKYVPENENRRFLGLKHLNLRAAPIDFSLMNEVAGYEIFKILGIPCTRISWAKLYITEIDEEGKIVTPKEYKGLYLLTEDIDKTFLRCNFKNPEGNLYKTTDIQANLEYRANLKEFLTWDGRRVYELRTNEELDDYSDLEKFIRYINYNWSNIHEVSNLTLLAKYFAASIFQGNWDDYVFLPHNYWLYSDPNFGFVLIPWDIEQNFNIGTNHSVIQFGAPDFRSAPLLSGYKGWYDNISFRFGIDPYTRPLWDNLINDTNFKDEYLNQHEKIVNNTASLIVQLEEWFDLIQSTVIIPYQFTDPYPSVEGYPNQIPYMAFIIEKTRVLTFIEARAQFIKGQLL
ncbi:MAG: CotH kinase family protein [Promethearchaeota archaeon]